MTTGQVDWQVSVDATIAARTSTNEHHPLRPGHRGLGRSPNLPLGACKPAGHGIGRPRGRLTTKIHPATNGHGRPLAAVITADHRNDGALLLAVLADIAVIAEKAYSSVGT